MKIYSYVPTDYFGSNMYLIDFSGIGVLIDPSLSYDKLSDFLENNDIKLEYIFITHAHFDHFLMIDSWVLNTKAKVIIGKSDAAALSDSYYNCYKLFLGENGGYFGDFEAVSDGDIIKISNEAIEVIETPGHSKGSVSLKVGNNLFVGDLVFSGNSYGRCDLPGGDFEALRKSVERIKRLPDETVVYSGHGRNMSIKEIKTFYI